MAKDKGRRARGTGTVFYHATRKVWVGRVRRDGVTVERSDRTQAGLVAKLAAATPPAAGCTLREWCTRWLDAMDCRPQTSRLRRSVVTNYVVPSLGHLRVADITPGQIERAAASWTGTLASPNSVRQVLGILGTCLQSAVRHGLRADNPARVAVKPRSTRTRLDVLSPADLGRVIAAATDHPRTRFLALLAAVGCRVGEALALDATDFDPAAGAVSISRTFGQRGELGPPKSENGVRIVRVPAAALPAVRAASAGRTSGPLFAPRRTYNSARRAWVALLDRLGLPPRNLHQLRHSVASALVAAGVPIADVARYLGDAVATVVRVYLHPSGADPADTLDALFAPTSRPPYEPDSTRRNPTAGSRRKRKTR